VTENLYGSNEVRAFRKGRYAVNVDQEVFNFKVVTFGADTAAVTLEFRRVMDGVVRLGRQSQMWRKFPQGWKIVSAHVSLFAGVGVILIVSIELPAIKLCRSSLSGFIDILDVNYRLFLKPFPTSVVLNLPDMTSKVRKQYIQPNIR